MTNMFYIGLQVLGLVCTLPLSRKIPRWFLVSTSFLWGMLLWMGCSLVIVLLGIPYSWLSTGIFLLLILIVSVYFIINTGTYKIPVRDWLLIAGSLVAIILLSTLLTETSYVFSTTDSFNYIYHGKVLARSGFVPWTINNFTKLGSFSSIIQMSSHLLPGEYISGYQTILAVELLFVVYIGTWNELKQEFRSATALIISTALILVLGSVTFLEHAFYIHNNLPAGLLLFLTLFSFWHYFKTNHREWSLIGSIALVGFSFTRIEGPLYAVLILLIIISIQPQPYKKTLRMVLPYTFITTLWHIFLLINAVQNEQLSKTNLLLIIGALAGLAFLALISKWIPGLIDMLPNILISVLFFSLILAFLIEPEHMILSINPFLAKSC